MDHLQDPHQRQAQHSHPQPREQQQRKVRVKHAFSACPRTRSWRLARTKPGRNRERGQPKNQPDNNQCLPFRPTNASGRSQITHRRYTGPMSTLPFVSDTFAAARWREVEGFDFSDITYHRGISRGPEQDGRPAGDDMPVVRIAFDRPDVRNAFRPQTVDELYRALDHARMTSDVAAVNLTGNGPSARDGGYGFCSGGDQRIRGKDGYRYEVEGANPDAELSQRREQIDPARAGRLHILEVQRLIRTMPKPVIAAVTGWAAGGGHSLMVVCDLAVASLEHARLMQTDANVGSFDAGYGSALLARQAGDKRAREIFFLAREYSASQAAAWGVVNEAVPHEKVEDVALEYARIIATKSPQAIRMLKFAFNMADDGIAGQQVFAGEATRMAYMTEEAQEGRDAFLEHRTPNWQDYPYYY